MSDEAIDAAAGPALRAPESFEEHVVSREVTSMLNVTDATCEVIAAARTTYKMGGLPLTTVQKLKLKVSLEQMGRAAWCLADELGRSGPVERGRR